MNETRKFIVDVRHVRGPVFKPLEQIKKDI